jgi:uncharacterized protein with PIN domain
MRNPLHEWRTPRVASRHSRPEANAMEIMMSIPYQHPDPIPDTTRDRCPGCATAIAAELQLMAERVAASVRLPHLTLVCAGCQRTFVIAPPLSRKSAA